MKSARTNDSIKEKLFKQIKIVFNDVFKNQMTGLSGMRHARGELRMLTGG